MVDIKSALRFDSVARKGFGPVLAVSAVLTLGACSSIGSMFGSDEPAVTESQSSSGGEVVKPGAPVGEGLIGPGSVPDYIAGERRKPVSRAPLSDAPPPVAPVAPVSSAPAAPAPVSSAPAPTAMAVAAPSPSSAASIAPPPAPVAPVAAPQYSVAPTGQAAAAVPAVDIPPAAPAASDVPAAAPVEAGMASPYSAEDVKPVYASRDVPPAASVAAPHTPDAAIAQSPVAEAPVEQAPGGQVSVVAGDVYDAPLDVDAGTVVIGGDGAVVVPGYQDTLAGAVPVGVATNLRSGAQMFDVNAPGALGTSTLVAAIQFETGSTGLSGQDRTILRQVTELQQRYGSVVRVVGHASSFTDDMTMPRHETVNLKISTQRADRVASALMSYGVPKDMVYIAAAADAQPIYMEIMPSGQIGNQRAEVYLDY